MTSSTRLVLLVLTFAYALVFGPGSAFSGGLAAHLSRAHRAQEQRAKANRIRMRRVQAHVARQSAFGTRAVQYARGLLGSPYRYGGDSPRTGFDCSGFVRFVYGHFGVRLPHSSYADFDLGRGVPRTSLRPGDLVFFDGTGHVGMYIGGGRFIHAPHTGASVEIASLSDPWYQSRYDGARRLVAQPLAHAARRVRKAVVWNVLNAPWSERGARAVFGR
jgi:cell wall-associated NlpC family hydrolase